MKENENSAGYTYLAVSRPPATVELLRRSGKDRGEEGTQGKENQISFDQELKGGGRGLEDRPRLCQQSNRAFMPQCWPIPEPRHWE